MSPGHSRKEGEVTLMEDNACDPFLSEDVSRSHSCFIWTHLLLQWILGASPLCMSLLRESVLPSRLQSSQS